MTRQRCPEGGAVAAGEPGHGFARSAKFGPERGGAQLPHPNEFFVRLFLPLFRFTAFWMRKIFCFMTAPALIITQCLQNDFVAPLNRYEALPNQLHVGYDEARRLIGEDPLDGPVHRVMEWAYNTSAEQLGIVHIRDWHNAADEKQSAHLNQFGHHCIKDTPGADFVFRQVMQGDREHHVVDASGLNDFVDTNLAAVLEPYRGKRVRVGLLGVWTEAKITFLAYDLITRYPEFDVVVCSALTASSSRQAHFTALEQLQNILGVRSFPSVAAFTEYLTGEQPAGAIADRIRNSRIDASHLKFDPPDYSLEDVDMQLLLYLFRDAKSANFRVLDGGFSGNVVLGAQSLDRYGHSQVPHVVKIGPRDSIARERISFERVQEVLGNSAPNVVDFAEVGERGAIKYRYAGMLGGDVKTFQKLYQSNDSVEGLQPLFRILDVVFVKQLGRFYEAAGRERLNLLEYYDFQAKYAPGVRKRVEALLGGPVPSLEDLDPAQPEQIESMELVPGVSIPNVCLFYERDLPDLVEAYAVPHYLAYVHGDLNGANILVDASGNVWLIDFFHTHRGHVLKDLIKLENDLLFIFTKIENEAELREALRLTDVLLEGEDLGQPPVPARVGEFKSTKIQRAYLTACRLRSYYPELIELDRDPYQLYAGIVRYAMHTLSFEESNEWQRRWALYAGAVCADRIRSALRFTAKLRVDVVATPSREGRAGRAGELGLTILPGRKDRSRKLDADLAVLDEEGFRTVLCLLTEDEFERYGIPELRKAYADRGFSARYFAIPDQNPPSSLAEADEVVEWMDGVLGSGENLLVHCVGGLGRSGTMAACYLLKFGGFTDPAAAIQAVREARSPRAIETRRQEEFIEEYARFVSVAATQ